MNDITSFLLGGLGADVVHPFSFSAVNTSDPGYPLRGAVKSASPKIPARHRSTRVAERILIVDAGEPIMKVRGQRWGNSLALPIPKAMAAQAQIGQHSALELEVVDGKLVAAPVLVSSTLEQLLAGITDDNLHAEVDFASGAGSEIDA